MIRKLRFDQLLFKPRRSLFGGLQSLAQTLIRFPIDPILVREGLEGRKLLAQLIDFNRPVILVRELAFLWLKTFHCRHKGVVEWLG